MALAYIGSLSISLVAKGRLCAAHLLPMVERWLSVDEIAAHLGVSRETVYRWIDSRALPGHRIGKFWKFKTSEVDKWASHPSPTTSYKKHSVDGNRTGKRNISRKSS